MIITRCEVENRRDVQGLWEAFSKHSKGRTVPLHTAVSTSPSSLFCLVCNEITMLITPIGSAHWVHILKYHDIYYSVEKKSNKNLKTEKSSLYENIIDTIVFIVKTVTHV